MIEILGEVADTLAAVASSGAVDAIGDAGYLMGALGATTFIILYATLARFWASQSGWHIFTFMATVDLVLIHSSISIYFPDYPGRDLVRAILYPALAAIIFWRIAILIRVQVYNPRRNQEK